MEEGSVEEGCEGESLSQRITFGKGLCPKGSWFGDRVEDCHLELCYYIRQRVWGVGRGGGLSQRISLERGSVPDYHGLRTG